MLNNARVGAGAGACETLVPASSVTAITIANTQKEITEIAMVLTMIPR